MLRKACFPTLPKRGSYFSPEVIAQLKYGDEGPVEDVLTGLTAGAEWSVVLVKEAYDRSQSDYIIPHKSSLSP